MVFRDSSHPILHTGRASISSKRVLPKSDGCPGADTALPFVMPLFSWAEPSELSCTSRCNILGAGAEPLGVDSSSRLLRLDIQ